MSKINSTISLFSIALCSMLFSQYSYAIWKVSTEVDSNATTPIAFVTNQDGYTVEIYKDSVGAVRSRFSVNEHSERLAEKHCPTFQIDNLIIDNRSINNAPCISNHKWSEFVLGYIKNNEVVSAKLNALINGINFTFRFMLANGAYEETRFSLEGSKRATLKVIGGDINITQ